MNKVPLPAFGVLGAIALVLAGVAIGYSPQRPRRPSVPTARSTARQPARFAETAGPAWRILGPGGGGAFYSPAISPTNDKIILASTDMTGCYISKDGGVTWRAFYLRTRCTSFSFDAKNPDVFYALAGGLFITSDG